MTSRSPARTTPPWGLASTRSVLYRPCSLRPASSSRRRPITASFMKRSILEPSRSDPRALAPRASPKHASAARAVLVGLEGAEPETIDPDSLEPSVQRIRSTSRLRLLGEHEIAFDVPMQLLLMRHERLPRHSNGMRFTALGADRNRLREEDYYSIGGGFIVRGDEEEAREARAHAVPPYPFTSGAQLLGLCREHGLEMYELVLANERALASEAEVRAKLMHIWQVMQACVERG